MSDLISRQAAIDALEREKTYCTAFRDGYTPIDVFEKYNAGLTDGIKALKNLPSAQPMMTNAADLINRGDAILAVYKRIKQLGMENDADVLSIRQSIRDLASAQPYTEEEIQAMQDLEQAQLDKAYQIGVEEGLRSAQPQWIPCSERLPEKNGEYLVTRWTGYLPKSLIIDIAKYYEGEWRKAFPVDAWMPLPEPWKGESEETA